MSYPTFGPELVNQTLAATLEVDTGGTTPTDVRATLTAPDDTQTVVLLTEATTLTEVATDSQYQLTWFADQVGTWFVVFDVLGAGAVSTGAAEASVVVRARSS